MSKLDKQSPVIKCIFTSYVRLLQRPSRRHVPRRLGARGRAQGHGAGAFVHSGVQLQHGPAGQRAAAAGARAARAARDAPRAPQVHAAHIRRGKPVSGLCAVLVRNAV